MQSEAVEKIAEHGQMLSYLLTDIMEPEYLQKTSFSQLTRKQFSILKILNHSGPAAGSELASVLNISRPAVSKNIKKLAQLKLIFRKNSSVDKRSMVISLTQAGRKLVKSYKKLRLKKQEKSLARLKSSELEQFSALFGRYVQNGLLLEEKTDIVCLQCSGLISDECLLAEYNGSCRFRNNR